jgi:nucleotide-binding universal stress UspA family protein
MYKRIILAVDLADTSSAPKGLEQGLELTKLGGGALRLVNVQQVVPATFM